MKKILLIIPFILIFCGCNDYKELNNIAIVSGLAVDIKDNQYKVSILVANSNSVKESDKEGTAGNAVYDATGTTMSEALKKLDNIMPKQIYLGHLGVVVISEEVGKLGVDNITDYFFRNPETTKRFYLIMTRGKDKAGDVLKILSPLESFPFQNIRLNIENSSSSGSISDNLTYSEFLENYLKKGTNPYLPTIKIYGSVKKGSSTKTLESADIKSYIGTKGLALFKESKFVGYATNDESRGINIVLGSANDTLIRTKWKDGYIITVINDIKVKRTLKYKNNKPYFYINIKGSGDIEEVTSNIDLYDEINIEDIEKDINKNIKHLTISGIEKAKKYGTDIFEFGNTLYKNNPKYFNVIDDWDDYFKTLNINIDVDIQIKNKGTIKQSIKGA